MKITTVLFLLCVIAVSAQHRLSVTVEGVKSSEGEINIALYNEAHGFLKFDRAFKADSTKAQQGTTAFTIENLPEGVYAIALFHDINSNKQLDTNWLGIPKERVAFSKSKMKKFGPPCFEDCAFPLQNDRTLVMAFH
ncbi:DUF2141 domain-containing protein [Arenibacter sp. GZD96]|uniref:DUF2141 domain-containing protein n=1 Tax=Aurantibrevibacter litoralis TaxID=3106030 RepID=UPI002AFF4BFE|nr:DUF2141 domain-containing protein [Arenibacter sp. GZD-96]MEA1786407.1 DUF2141 domain-containing protein [Arenibacter sp. GZD-96]